MNNGQYYRSEELVDLIHKNFSGFHAGYRGVHASGRYYAAIFKASGEAAKLSRAAHFQGHPFPRRSVIRMLRRAIPSVRPIQPRCR